jgi:hypothetical protein
MEDIEVGVERIRKLKKAHAKNTNTRQLYIKLQIYL